VNSTKKKRKSTSDAIGFLEKKAEQEMALRREEIKVRKQEEMRGSQQTTMQQEMLRMNQQQQKKKSNPTAAIYAVHVEPTAITITGSSEP